MERTNFTEPRSLRSKAFAKINLYLAVTGKRPDGYHDIESVMQTVSLADDVTVTLLPSECRRITLRTNGELPCDRRNIAYRAAEAFLSSPKAPSGLAADIEIGKRIPVAGGLAGGSADAAAVLRAMNKLCGTPMAAEELLRLGASLGADIPFCITGGTSKALGIGDRLSPLPSMPRCAVLIARPHESVSTADAYAKIDTLRAVSKPPLASMENALFGASLHDIASSAYNVFESVMDDGSEIHLIKRVMNENGALLAMMSGSGPTVFGIFADAEAASPAAASLKTAGYEPIIAYPEAAV